ncbi:hypothetical protein SDRG_02828 [Saprolegnia diclina VS20]|uniref:Biogenesis of lysosome-related organelles complex 1 subunit 7 n=1 Tax=Saprolegnia diclina (strain VS20) TaxID=1156394 RepID=T0R1H6_SAPDV|nr:hypothetical protein SDRG_02828 [Saprolegnia diclina VS20]EQC40180.1 hypothetical protein SDRG_02828 [Saprolegnia diclina VS20]|eukprot:XP_008606654.1 hypothetical protein SDRG_02828 [Saprolegnia diclina VS20]
MDDESETMLPPETSASHLAVGMYMALWPKIEKCDGYVGMLLDTQESLQEKIAELMGLLDGGADTTSPLVGYAARLKQFPSRVQALQAKLEGIRALLASLRKPDVVIPEPPKAAPPVVVAAINDEEDEREASAPAHNVATEDVAPQ